MAKLGIIKCFNASHGSNKHYHDFKVEIILQGELKDNMVEGIDFHDVRKTIEEELILLEGKYLDDYLNVKATVENIAIYLIKRLREKRIDKLYQIKIFEEADRYAEIYDNEVIC